MSGIGRLGLIRPEGEQHEMTRSRSGLLAEAARRHSGLLDDLRGLVETESPSSDLDAIRRSAEAVAALVARRLRPEEIETLVIDGCSHLRIRWDDGPRRLLLLAHHDTVWPLGTLEQLPWSVRDGVIRGPGVFDMKLGLVQAVHALAILEENADPLPNGVTLLVTGDEELGSPTSRALIEEEAAVSDAVLVLEAAADGGALKSARKGVSQYTILARGRASHAGLEPEAGVNAGLELAHQLLAVSGWGDAEAETTVTPTVLSAGTTENTVPAQARAAVDVRAWTRLEQERIDRAFRALSPVIPGAALEILGGVNRPPFEEEQARALYERARAVAGRLGIPVPGSARVGGASDGNFTAGLGVPTLDGLGAVGGGAHALSEHALEEFIDGRVALLAGLMAAILQGRPG